MIKFMIGAAVAGLCSAAAVAQNTYVWPAPVTQGATGTRSYFPMGTPIMLRTRTEANTKQMKPGDRVALEVAESLVFRGQIVVPAGAPAVGEVVRSEPNGGFGKRGEIEMRLLELQTPHGPVRLDGTASDKGRSHVGWAVAGAVLVGWPAALLQGTSGYIRAGTAVHAILADDLRFTAYPTAVADAGGMPAQADGTRPLPARFDPSVFGGNGSRIATR